MDEAEHLIPQDFKLAIETGPYGMGKAIGVYIKTLKESYREAVIFDQGLSLQEAVKAFRHLAEWIEKVIETDQNAP